MILIMKAGHLRPSCAKRMPVVAAPPAIGAFAAQLSSRPALVRHKDRTMTPQAKPIRAKLSHWGPTAVWISLRRIVERGQPDCPSATLRNGRRDCGLPAI